MSDVACRVNAGLGIVPAMERTALIAGAGIGGLSAGIALQRAGWQVRVFERAASVRELGFGLLLAPNAIAPPGAEAW